MNPIWIFLAGFLGSTAVELLSVYRLYYEDEFELPYRFRRLDFYIVRILIAVVSGGLALAYNVESLLLAVHVGASAPIILTSGMQAILRLTETPEAKAAPADKG